MQYLIESFTKNSLTSNPSSSDLKISWVIASNWLRQESPGLNPDWFGEIKLFLVKKVNISLQMRRSKILLQIGSKEKLAYSFLDSVYFLSYVRVQRLLFSIHYEIYPHSDSHWKLFKKACRLSFHLVLSYVHWAYHDLVLYLDVSD